MGWWGWLLLGLGVFCVVWGAFVLLLVVAGRRSDARALATFIPDCIVLVTRLVRDPRVPRRRKVLLLGLVGYLALPFDLVPDFIPSPGSSTTRSLSPSCCAISSVPAASPSFASFGRGRSARWG
jgi:hypothetical protein